MHTDTLLAILRDGLEEPPLILLLELGERGLVIISSDGGDTLG